MSKARKWRGISPNAEKPYAWFSIAATERLLQEGDHGTLAVYTGLCIREALTGASDKESFFASENNIARACGMSARRVRKHLEILERLRLVVRVRPTGRARIEHQASRWTLTSITPTGRNVLTEQDETSLANRTLSPAKTSDIKDTLSPYRTKKESKASLASPPLASPGGGAKQKFGYKIITKENS